MKKKIGFIDYSIDEWHANNYPGMISESSRKDEFEVYLAWEDITKPGVRDLQQWCKDLNVRAANGIEQVVEQCDCIVVLSPDDPQEHEKLADLPLRSGKPVYIDKPFAPDAAAARRMIDKAKQYNTPMISSSALRFGSDIQKAVSQTLSGQNATFAATRGPGAFMEYSIHQIEMLVMLLGTGATKVMQCGSSDSRIMLIDYPDKRRGVMTQMPCEKFQVSFEYGDNQHQAITAMTDFFPNFIEAMLEFFSTGAATIKHEEMIEIAALVATGIKALDTPDTWIDLQI